MRQRFQGEYTDCGQRRVLSTVIQRNAAPRDTALAGREKLKITEMRIPSKGNSSTDTAYQGEIVILPSDSVRLNDVLGDQTRLPVKGGEDPSHAADDDCAENGSAKRTAAGSLLRNLRILTRFCVAKWIPSPRDHSFFFGPGAVGGCFRLLSENTSLKQW